MTVAKLHRAFLKSASVVGEFNVLKMLITASAVRPRVHGEVVGGHVELRLGDGGEVVSRPQRDLEGSRREGDAGDGLQRGQLAAVGVCGLEVEGVEEGGEGVEDLQI